MAWFESSTKLSSDNGPKGRLMFEKHFLCKKKNQKKIIDLILHHQKS